ncbi:hypothetical protein [Exiguobacterium qingdaonense]|uniref:hypothetical protein n=1 Tax=Exiguobacterium qingdaonense TaxID=2751251 RepID=UPI001BEBB18A|nr:hypothetical protein [Exiguobacterium qingdaonense]
MKRLLVICIIGLIGGNTLTLIALTTNISQQMSQFFVFSGVGITILSIVLIVLTRYYAKKSE